MERTGYDDSTIVKQKLDMFMDMTGKSLDAIEKDCGFEAGTLVTAFAKCNPLDDIKPLKMGEIINRTYNLDLSWSQGSNRETYPKDKIKKLTNCKVIL